MRSPALLGAASTGWGLVLALALPFGGPLDAAASRPLDVKYTPRRSAHPPPHTLPPPPACVWIDAHLALGVLGDLVDFELDVEVVLGTPCPTTTTTATTTTTTTTTTTLPPPTTTTAPPLPLAAPRPPPPLPPSAPPPPPTSTTTTSTTTTTTTTPAPPPPPIPAAAPPPRLTVTASLDPAAPLPGAAATALITVRNDGTRAVEDVTLTDELSASATVRSASTDGGGCEVAGRRADCGLGRLASGDVVTTEVRLLVEPEPADRTVAQHITVGGAGQPTVVDRTVSTLVDPGPSRASEILGLPGPTVTLVAFVGFVLASHGGSTPRPSRASR